MEDALPREIEAGAAVHAAFDELEAVDLSFDRAIAPGLDDGRAHGRFVLPKPRREATEIGRGRLFQPGFQLGRIGVTEKIGEGADLL